MENWEPIIEFDNFIYAENDTPIILNQYNYLCWIKIYNEYTAVIYYIGIKQQLQQPMTASAGCYYVTGTSQDLTNVQAMGTLESDSIPDIVLGVNQTDSLDQCTLYIQLDKLDPEKFPLFFV